MKKFYEVARQLAQQGDNFLSQHPIKLFPEFASALLSEKNPSQYFDLEYLDYQSLEDNSHPEQHFKQNEFSNLPVTIARGENCFVDLYFWNQGMTSIHSHNFHGGFHCLAGQNVDFDFSFRLEKQLTESYAIGDIEFESTTRLDVGRSQSIRSEEDYIHVSYHREPSINLCLRTGGDMSVHINQYFLDGSRLVNRTHARGKLVRLVKYLNLQVLNKEKDSFLRRNLELLTTDDLLHLILDRFAIDLMRDESTKDQIQEICQEIITQRTGRDIKAAMALHQKKLSKYSIIVQAN